MAWLERRANSYRIVFRFASEKFHYSLKTGNERTATAALARLEENLYLLEHGRLELPPGADLATFLISDGKLNGKPVIEKALTLGEMIDRYKKELPEGAKEASTRYSEKVHLGHLRKILKSRTPMTTITTRMLQHYIDSRSKQKGRQRRPVSHETIRKEIGTFGSMWNKFAVPMGIVHGPAPTRGLIYHKIRSKPPFQTWEQIERQIARGGLTSVQEEDLWDALFLSVAQVEELLDYVRKQDRLPFLYPMFLFAAHTGARRSEMLRSLIDDFDFASKMVRIRERKRDKSRESTFRYVPMSDRLAQNMATWFTQHPGGQFTICLKANEPISAMMAYHYFVDSVAGSKWAKLRGWHVFRHSFISNCAAKRVDQRMIDEWVSSTRF
jgi:integrase